MIELSVMVVVLLLIAGVGVGVASGLVGVGGGILIVPLLVLGFAFTQKQATGTSLALLMFPLGALAVRDYHLSHNIDWRVVMLLAPGFIVGALLGARLVTSDTIPEKTLKLIFAVLLLYTVHMLLSRSVDWYRGTIGVLSSLTMIFFAYWLLRLLGRNLDQSSRYGELYRKHIARGPGDDFVI